MNIQHELNQLANPVRAEGEKKYLKSPLKHYGVTIPALRRLAKKWLRENQDAPIKEVLESAQSLWVGEYHEERMIAIFLLVYRVKELTFTHLPIIEKMVNESTGWAQLDMIASWLCGHIFEVDKNQMTVVLSKWVRSDNFWVRRAALLTLLSPVRKDTSNFVLFDELATPLLSEKEFFIRKAIGWVLRELSKTNPEIVYQYVLEHASEMSGLTYREATRKLPPAYTEKLKSTR